MKKTKKVVAAQTYYVWFGQGADRFPCHMFNPLVIMANYMEATPAQLALVFGYEDQEAAVGFLGSYVANVTSVDEATVSVWSKVLGPDNACYLQSVYSEFVTNFNEAKYPFLGIAGGVPDASSLFNKSGLRERLAIVLPELLANVAAVKEASARKMDDIFANW
jgi:hypothetical protein